MVKLVHGETRTEPLDVIDRFPFALEASAEFARKWFVDGALIDAGSSYEWPSPTVPGSSLTAADVSPAEALGAVESARRAQEEWGVSPAFARSRLIRRLASYLEARRDEFAEMIAFESAKPIRYARGEVDSCVLMLETLCASVAEVGAPARLDYTTGRRLTTFYRPVGPALVISPWNFPLSLGLRKVATGLLAGCTVLWKPSDRSPLTALMVAQGFQEIGMPSGVTAVLPTGHSPEVVHGILESGKVRKLAFTGSTAVGMALMAEAAPQMVRSSFELGGNGAAVVGEGAKIELVAPAILQAKFANSGQVCTAINRLYVSRARHDELVDALRNSLDSYVVGWPDDERTQIGPLITASAARRVRGLIDESAAGGGIASEHGNLPPAEGQFVRPTIVDDVRSSDVLARNEIFGPVLPVIVFDDLATAIDEANSTPYGLSSYVFSSDAQEVEFAVSRMRSGMIAVNSASPSSTSAPFGGIGWSGNGRENGVRGITDYMDEITLQY
jgi:succinate-semialdehyde dehydrogenase/glutarate-semialdehyde dehydrogenase